MVWAEGVMPDRGVIMVVWLMIALKMVVNMFPA